MSGPRLPVRELAARLLLQIYVVAAVLVPIGHLATHRNDHTHGPEAGATRAAHAEAHRAGLAHGHTAGTPASGAPIGDATLASLGANKPGTPAQSELPAPDHGRQSVSHFDLALLEGPPPALVPPPAEALAPPPDAPLAELLAPPLPQPPVRGPPA